MGEGLLQQERAKATDIIVILSAQVCRIPVEPLNWVAVKELNLSYYMVTYFKFLSSNPVKPHMRFKAKGLGAKFP